jgi:hypothetical protein
MNIGILLGVGSGILFLLVVNGILLGIIFYSQRKANITRTWPSTTGVVQISTLEMRRSSSSQHNMVAYPQVVYTYQVGGQSYQSNRIQSGLEWGGSGARNVVVRYPVGSQVTVYYDPRNPAEALLERKSSSSIWLWVALLALDAFICFIAGVLYWAFSQ